MKILIMTDSPFINSGQARVGREIAIGLARRGHVLGYIGWWHDANIVPNLPHNIQFWWTNNSYYGSDILDRVIGAFRPDVLLTIGDMWNLDYICDPKYCTTRKYFQWCSYIPVDGEPECGGLPPGIIKTIEEIDIPVAYTEYAKTAILKSVKDRETRDRIKVIYHGVDTNTFHPVDPTERRKMREEIGIDDKFVFLTVSRNQSRKNVPELFKAWKEFSEFPAVKNKSIFWPHMNFKDRAGWDLDDMILTMGLKNNSIMYYDNVAHSENEKSGISEADLARLYQMADAFILLSNEGFGLPTLEAMATRLPCILLDHSASSEIGSGGRSFLIPKSGSLTWVGRYLTEKPVPDIRLAVDAMKTVMFDKKHREEIASAGYEFATRTTWDSVTEDWNGLFNAIEVPFLRSIKMEEVL